jgi:CheY-like chemotaxis protein
MAARVLLVEDEQTISGPLAEHLAPQGFDDLVASTIAEARVVLHYGTPDFVLLDVMLPDGDSRDLCREIRRRSDVPIVMLTARGEGIDRIVGLELGADDHVVQPFSARRADGTMGVSVGDHGPGIAPEERAKVRKRFSRGRSSATSKGSGLGLAISRELTEKWGRTLRIDEAEGGRALVVVRFRRADREDPS